MVLERYLVLQVLQVSGSIMQDLHLYLPLFVVQNLSAHAFWRASVS
jgi:hypothetical protein